MPSETIGRGGHNRRDERFGFPVRVLVNGGHETGGTPWEEVTTLRDASAGGASFLVDHPLTVGEVIRLQLLPPLPEMPAPFELAGPSRTVYAIVRSCVLDSRGRRVGVKFFEDVEGLMPPAAPGPPLGTEDRRLRDRYLTSVHFIAQQVDEYGAVLTEALTVAENISRGGAQLLAPIHVARGDTLLLQEAGGTFESRAEVRNASVDEGGLRRLNVMFLDGRSPQHLFPPAS
jgi:PilZ domain-containing protein